MDDLCFVDPLNLLAINLLEKVGVDTPTEHEINIMESALSHTLIKSELLFDKRLNPKEVACLFWAAKGKTIGETAKIMNLLPTAVDACRKSIKRKLQATSIAQAVFEGMRLNYLPQHALHLSKKTSTISNSLS